MTTSSPRRATTQACAAAAGAVLVIGLGAAGATAHSTSADTTGRPLSAVLSGANEVSPTGVLGVGDPDGSGSATVRINPGQNQLCYQLNWKDVGAVGAAHVHEAPAGTNGNVVIPLALDGRKGIAEGCATVERELLVQIMQDPSEYYVNLHTAAFPGGAVRGQLNR